VCTAHQSVLMPAQATTPPLLPPQHSNGHVLSALVSAPRSKPLSDRCDGAHIRDNQIEVKSFFMSHMSPYYYLLVTILYRVIHTSFTNTCKPVRPMTRVYVYVPFELVNTSSQNALHRNAEKNSAHRECYTRMSTQWLSVHPHLCQISQSCLRSVFSGLRVGEFGVRGLFTPELG
jgi:hypothetical protein